MNQRARHRRQPVTSGQTDAPRSDVHTRHVAVAGLTGPDPRRPPDASVTPRRLRPRPIPSRRPLMLPVAVARQGGCDPSPPRRAWRPGLQAAAGTRAAAKEARLGITCAARRGQAGPPVAVGSRGSGPRVKASGRRGPARFPSGDGACVALRRQGVGIGKERAPPSVSRFWKEIFVQESGTTAAGNPIMEKGSP